LQRRNPGKIADSKLSQSEVCLQLNYSDQKVKIAGVAIWNTPIKMGDKCRIATPLYQLKKNGNLVRWNPAKQSM